MTLQQYNRAKEIRDRIRGLKIMERALKNPDKDITIENYKVPDGSKEILVSMCSEEIKALETEFDNL